MTEKALISELTWRSLKMQKDAFPDMPHFHVDDMNVLFRKTTRKDTLHVHVLSLAIIATNEKEFRIFLDILKDRKSCLHSKEECLAILGTTVSFNKIVKIWKDARKQGAAKIGGKMSADIKKAKSDEAAAKIKDRWPLPSKEWPTKVLLKEANVSLNTVKSLLGKRPIAQYNFQAKMKRAAKKNSLKEILDHAKR